MAEITKYLNYKDYLKDILHDKESRGLQSKLARHLKTQSAYLYQVLKAKGDLTEDQAYKVTTFFQLDAIDTDYFLLLVRYAKAGTPELKNFIKENLNKKSDEKLNLKNYADANEPQINDAAWAYYFSDQLPSYIHILTSSDKFQTADKIARRLNQPVTLITKHLRNLSVFGFVSLNTDKWIHSSPSIHIPWDSGHNKLLQLMRRSQALSAILTKKNVDEVHFSSLFTLDKKAYDELRAQISEFVKKAQKTIHNGGTDEMYTLCVDLFESC